MKKVLPAFLALSFAAAAQTSNVSVPGVTLSGPLSDLTITNNSTKPIVAAMVLYYGADSKEVDGHERMFILDRPNYLAVGDSERMGTFHKGQGAELVVSAKVAAVIFADGEFQGGDDREATNFRRNMEGAFQSIRATFQLAQAKNWREVQALYDADAKGDIWKAAAASRLLGARDKGSDVSPYKHYGNLPTSTRKGGLLNKLRVPKHYRLYPIGSHPRYTRRTTHSVARCRGLRTPPLTHITLPNIRSIPHASAKRTAPPRLTEAPPR